MKNIYSSKSRKKRNKKEKIKLKNYWNLLYPVQYSELMVKGL